MRRYSKRPFAGLVERDNVSTAQAEVSAQRCAHFVFLAFDDHADNPAPRA